MKFVNRVSELAFLDRHFGSKKAEMLVIWGRRRVGKTSLLNRFADKKPVAYHMAVKTTPAQALARLSASLSGFFDDPLLRAQPLGSWEALFAYLASRRERFGLILDEFPYLVESSPELPSLLQSAWDSLLSQTRICLILCGSSVSMMERTLFSPKAPLYGRRTGQWKLQPFGPVELGLLLGGGLVSNLENYTVIGGVPMYAQIFDRRASLNLNIRRHILTKGETLYEELPFLLRQELREPRVYQAVLAAVSRGAEKFGEISSRTGLERANLTRYLAQLEELDLVRREVPVTEAKPHKSRKGLYRIADPFVRFWYRFVYPNLDRLERGDAAGVMKNQVAPRLHDYVSRYVEPALLPLFAGGRLSATVPFGCAHAGRHWSRTEEFDLVLLNEDRTRAFVGEIKWSKRPVAPGLIGDLKRRVERSGVFDKMRVTLALISRSGFRSSPPPGRNLRFIDLNKVG